MLPRLSFAHLPTPVEELPHLESFLGGPRLLIKRDDQTGLAFGGNKTRKLEYLLADARARGAEMVFTTGAAQSNHCRQTAAAAARCGFKCTLVLVGPRPGRTSANLFLDELLGANIIWTEKSTRDQVLQEAFLTAKEDGAKPYLIPYGGSNALGAYAYFQAYLEYQQQLSPHLADWIVFASSSGGTQAGLLAGALFSGSKTSILGISVDEPEPDLKKNVSGIIGELSGLLKKEIVIDPEKLLVNDHYRGEGYGVMNDADRAAVHLFAEKEGILLDPVYTGRAAAGLIDLIKKGFFTSQQRVLFWHTGGQPALFAERYLSQI
jgi:D-cysteine desulfhydrase family pyridoxal phosphate-dependent enzyme